MGFYQALSGLNSSEKALGVIGNNIANSTTVGFKSQSTQFSDIYAGAMGDNALAKTQAGSGVRISNIATNYTQGSTTQTGGELDMAINGSGFFRVVDENGTAFYTRNGQFYLDKNGYVRNATANNNMLTGFPADEAGNITGTTAQPLYVQSASIDPSATTWAQLAGNFDSRATAPSVDFTLPSATSVPSTNSYNMATSQQIYDSLGNSHALNYYLVKTEPGKWTMFLAVDNGAYSNVDLNISGVTSNYLNLQQFQTSNDELNDLITKYPELATLIRDTYPPAEGTDAEAAFNEAFNTLVTTKPGYAELANLYASGSDFLNDAQFSELKEYLDLLADYTDADPSSEANLLRAEIAALRSNAIDIEFDSNGRIVSPANPNDIGITITGLQTTTGGFGPGEVVDPNTGEMVNLGDLTFSLDITGSTQYGQTSAFTRNIADGNTAGDFSGISVSDSGLVSAKYSNGESRVLGQVALATFPSTHGLAKVGDNMFAETFDSGQAVIGPAGAGLNGTIVAQSIEESNVDLTNELIQMIIQQRSYQANAQTIKTQDSILSTIVSLR